MSHDTGDTLVRLPDGVIEGLRVLLEQGEQYQWATGDYLVEVVDEFRGYYERAGARHARAQLLRQLAKETGADISTLKDRENMARFYPSLIRERYHPLTYHQLRACKSAGEHWQEYAEWALANLPASVASIRHKIKADHNGQPEWFGRWERLRALAELIMADESAPSKIRGALRMVVNLEQ